MIRAVLFDAAATLIALREAVGNDRLQPGDHLLVAAFGGGLSWGAMVMEWSGVRSAAPAVVSGTSTATP